MSLKKRNRVEATFAMSSMTDLVFLLLLFFVMASTMSSPNDIKINLPTSRAQQATRPQVAKVSIDNLGNYFVALGKEKPVQIDPSYYKHRRRDEFLVGIAGVTMNLLLAVAASAILGMLHRTMPSFLYYNALGSAIGKVFIEVAVINLSLMLFNLLPVPPLDGFGVVCDLFNLRGSQFYNFVYFNSRYILMALIFFGIPSLILSPILSRILAGLMNIFGVSGWYYLL